jgi:putative transcriptional regulator
MRLPELLEEKGISRARLCKDLDLQRTNLNRYYRDNFQRVDANLIVKLCEYLNCDIADLLEIKEENIDN